MLNNTAARRNWQGERVVKEWLAGSGQWLVTAKETATAATTATPTGFVIVGRSGSNWYNIATEIIKEKDSR
jgi:hypothetical protein